MWKLRFAQLIYLATSIWFIYLFHSSQMIYLDVNSHKSISLSLSMSCSKTSNVPVLCWWINNWARFCCLFGERFNFMTSLNTVTPTKSSKDLIKNSGKARVCVIKYRKDEELWYSGPRKKHWYHLESLFDKITMEIKMWLYMLVM